jgi:predicted membrane protein
MQSYNNYNRKNTPVITGVILLVLGVFFLLDQLNVNLPSWLFRWEYIPIVVGIYSGSKRNFNAPYGWLIPIAIGCLFLIDNYFPVNVWNFIFPIILIGAGLLIILNATGNSKFLKEFNIKKNEANPNSSTNNNIENAEIISESNANTDYYYSATGANASQNNSYNSTEDTIESTSIFSGVKKIISSKNFKGGSIVAIMGGVEINLLNADMQSPAVLDITSIMGGARIIVPSNWQVKSEITAVMGGVEDKRPLMQINENSPKLLILKGTTIMGGIDIKSFI